MAVQSFRKEYTYRYKLTEKCISDSMQIAGINLTKDWIDFKVVKEVLNSFIHTPANLSGILDFEKKDLLTNEIVQQSQWEGDIPEIISRETLYAMERHELVPIAKYYLIDCVNKDAKMLVKLIIDFQTKRIEDEQSQLKLEKDIIKKENIEKELTNNKLTEAISDDVVERNNGFFGFGRK